MSSKKQINEFRKLLIKEALSFPIMACPQTNKEEVWANVMQHCKYYNPQYERDGCLLNSGCIWRENYD